MNITVSGYNRPRYLEQTLVALARCDGIGQCKVTVFLDKCDEAAEQAAMVDRYGWQCLRWEERQGCNLAIGKAFAWAFADEAVEFNIHCEDDTVPTRDCLRWFAWARDAYRRNPAVMNVSGYQRVSNGSLDEAGLRRWFTPWGWGTWRDRWGGLAAGWAAAGPEATVSWDAVVNHVLRAGRFEVFPTVSRIQNIGGENGTHVPNAEWHALHHHVPETADDLARERPWFAVESWTQTREDEHADHA